jgi:threonine/homoserine/homoserine lactone efflux protein
MFGIHDLWAFVAASFLLWLTPGPDTMYILARSIAQGRRAGVMSALGIGSGLLIHTLLAAYGLSVILAASAWAFAAVKTAGAVYLIYLGLKALRKKIGRLDAPGISPLGSWRVYRQGVVSNTLNPRSPSSSWRSCRSSSIRRRGTGRCHSCFSGLSSS